MHLGSGQLLVGKGGVVVCGFGAGGGGVAPFVGTIGDAGIGGAADAGGIRLRNNERAVVVGDVECAALGIQFDAHLIVAVAPVVVVEPEILIAVGGDGADVNGQTELGEVVGVVANVVVREVGAHVGGVIELHVAAVVPRGVEVGVEVGHHDFVDDERFCRGAVVGDGDGTRSADAAAVDGLGDDGGRALAHALRHTVVADGDDRGISGAPRELAEGGVLGIDGGVDGCRFTKADTQRWLLHNDALHGADGTPEFQPPVVEETPVGRLQFVAVDAQGKFAVGNIDLQLVVVHTKGEVIFAALHAVGVVDVLANFGVVEEVGTVGTHGGVFAVAGLDGDGFLVGVEVGIDTLVAGEVLVEEVLAAVARAIEGADGDAVVAIWQIADVLIGVERCVPEFASPHPALCMANIRALPALVGGIVEVRVDNIFRRQVNPSLLCVGKGYDKQRDDEKQKGFIPHDIITFFFNL